MAEDDQRVALAFVDLVCRAATYVYEPWFSLPFAGATVPESAVRERVYCYELYHQIRKLTEEPSQGWAAIPGYVLSAEIDKSGINSVVEGGQQKPDLVWHVPGVRRNAVVMEVKASESVRYIEKDLQTLALFLDAPSGPYARGVLLVYGDSRSAEDLRTYVFQKADHVGLSGGVRTRIDLLHHRVARERAMNLGTLC